MLTFDSRPLFLLGEPGSVKGKLQSGLPADYSSSVLGVEVRGVFRCFLEGLYVRRLIAAKMSVSPY